MLLPIRRLSLINAVSSSHQVRHRVTTLDRRLGLAQGGRQEAGGHDAKGVGMPRATTRTSCVLRCLQGFEMTESMVSVGPRRLVFPTEHLRARVSNVQEQRVAGRLLDAFCKSVSFTAVTCFQGFLKHCESHNLFNKSLVLIPSSSHGEDR